VEYSSSFVFDYYDDDDDVGEVKSFVVFPSGEENTFLLQVVPGALLFSRREKTTTWTTKPRASSCLVLSLPQTRVLSMRLINNNNRVVILPREEEVKEENGAFLLFLCGVFAHDNKMSVVK